MKAWFLFAALTATLIPITDARNRCITLEEAHKRATDAKGSWVTLNRDQWLFLRGAFSVWPGTPPGMPLGDKAAMISSPEHETALIFFLDGNQACDMIAIPKEVKALLLDTDDVKHEGEGL